MKKSISDLFDSYIDEDTQISCNSEISPKRITELTKKRILEDEPMKNNYRKKLKTILIAAALICAITCTAFATIHFLSPKDVAQQLDMYALADVFSKEDRKFDIESQTAGNYKIDLLGVTSGKNLSVISEANADSESLYIVGAISKKDGSKITDYSGLNVIPIVKGVKPWDMNIHMSKQAFIYEGIEYFIIDCDTLNEYDEKTVYIAIMDDFSLTSDRFEMANDGTISFKASYSGAKALFEIEK